jgi:hypothetical protein
MQELSTEDWALLERLIQAREARELVPADQRPLVSRGDKYAFPIGLDDEGNAFPVPDQPAVPDRANDRHGSVPFIELATRSLLSSDNLKDIPIEDLVAVKSYISEDYGAIDGALRRMARAKLEQLDAYIRVATSGLYRLPPYRGPVYRATTLSGDIAAKYVPGITVREHSFVSSVASPTIRFCANTTFVIASVNGRDVSMLSDHPEEGEVVSFSDTCFRVLAVQGKESSAERTIYMAEIPDARLCP